MSCMLHISGENFDIDDFLSVVNIVPHSKRYKGQPKFPKSQPDGPRLSRSGCSFITSYAGFEEFDKQVEDTIAFLKEKASKLNIILNIASIEYAYLSFGIRRVDGFSRNIYFPQDLVALACSIGLGIEASIYEPSSD